MTVKQFKLTTGKQVKLGRKRPTVFHPKLALKNYLLKDIPPPPPVVTYVPSAAPALAQMYENDQLGDCVIAAVEHCVGVFTANAGNSPIATFTDTQTTDFYSAACGYVPGDANTDQGCDIQQVLSYWENNGAANDPSHTIVGVLAVDPSNIQEVQTALWLFENLIFGVELPDSWLNGINSSGFTWDVAGAPDPNNGHCFAAFGYDPNKLTISTWGMTGYITNAAVSMYAASSAQGELYAVISQDALNSASKLAPNGLNWDQLVADFTALGGQVVNPNPNPNPPPPPGPNPNPNPNPNPPVPVTPDVLQDLMRIQHDFQRLGKHFDQLVEDIGLSIGNAI